MAEQFGITVTPDGAGSAQVAAAGAEVAVARKPWDMFDTAVKVIGTQVAKEVTETKALEDSLAGQNRAATRLAEISTMSPADRAAALAQDRADIEGGESEFSDVHNKAYLSATTSTFFSATAKAQAETNMKNAASNVDSMIIPEMLPEGYDKIGAFEWIADNNGVDVATVRDMYLTKQTDYFSAQIQFQSDQEGVDEIKAAIAKNKETLMGPKFYGSRSADWKAAIKSSNAKLQAAEVAVQKKFKKEAENRISTSIGDTASSLTSYIKPLDSEMKKDFKLAYTNDITYNNKVNEYKAKHEEATTSREFQAINEPGDVHPKIPDGAQLKKEWQTKVTSSLQSSFIGKNYNKFIDIAINEPEYVKDAGNNLMTTFNNIDDPVVLQSFINNMSVISYQTNGATALRQALGDTNYVDIIATKYMAESGLAGDITKARAAVQQGKQNIARVDMDKRDMMDMQEYARDLGSQGQKYASVMQKLHAIDPAMAHKELKNVASFFDEQITTMGDRTLDISMTPKIDNISLDADRTETKLLDELDKQAGGEVSNVVVIGDTVLGIDPMTGAVAITGITKNAEEVNSQIKREKQLEAFAVEDARGTLTGDIAKAWDIHTQSLVGEVPSVFAQFGASAGEAVSNIVSRFGGYLGKSWDEDVQDLKDRINVMFPDTFKPDQAVVRYEAATDMLDEFDKIVLGVPTEDPRKYISNNTLSSYVNDQLTATLENNKSKIRVAEEMQQYLYSKLELENPELLFNDKKTLDRFNELLNKDTASQPINTIRGLP